MASTGINNKIECSELHANLDAYYGPYESKQEAFDSLEDVSTILGTISKKHIGLTVGIWDDVNHTNLTEYWFQGGTNDVSYLTQKHSQNGSGMPEGFYIASFYANGGNGHQNSEITDGDGYLVFPQNNVSYGNVPFLGWSERTDGIDPYMIGDEVQLTENKKFYAVWDSAHIGHTININTENVQSIMVNGVPYNQSTEYMAGDSIEIIATPNAHYNTTGDFWSWYEYLPNVNVNGNTLTFDMPTSNVTISATGTPDMHTLIVGVDESCINMGSITITSPSSTDNKFAYGTDIKINIVPESDHELYELYFNGKRFSASSITTPYTFTIDTDTEIVCVFQHKGAIHDTIYVINRGFNTNMSNVSSVLAASDATITPHDIIQYNTYTFDAKQYVGGDINGVTILAKHPLNLTANNMEVLDSNKLPMQTFKFANQLPVSTTDQSLTEVIMYNGEKYNVYTRYEQGGNGYGYVNVKFE